MAETKRRPPALLERPEPQSLDRARYLPFPWQSTAVTSNPVISYRIVQLEPEPAVAFMAPHFAPVMGQQPGRPVIEVRYGRDILRELEPFVPARYNRFPFREEVAAANPVIAYRYGREILAAAEAFGRPEYQRFPFPSTAPPPAANPVIEVRYGRPELLRDEAFVKPEHQRFPFFQEPPGANPVIEIRYGRPELLRPEAFVPAQHLRFPFFQEPPPASPVIVYRYGRDVLPDRQAFVMAAHMRFPYWIEPMVEAMAASQIVIAPRLQATLATQPKIQGKPGVN